MQKFLSLTIFFLFASVGVSGASTAGRYAVERDVTASVTKDLAIDYHPDDAGLEGRRCLDGRYFADGMERIDFWASLECSYCGIREAVKAQQAHPDWCIIVRHRPSSPEGLRKALAFEALKKHSSSAAVMFWDSVIPKADLPVPHPYEGALLRAYSEASIPQEEFVATLEGEAATTVSADAKVGQSLVSSTPTYVLRGIRFASCDFTAQQLEAALALARKARKGDTDAVQEVIRIVTRGRMNEKML